MAIGGADDDEVEESEDEDDDGGDAWSAEDISHFGGRRTCLGCGTGSLASGVGRKRTPKEPRTGSKVTQIQREIKINAFNVRQRNKVYLFGPGGHPQALGFG